jgi:hypothetical protein
MPLDLGDNLILRFGRPDIPNYITQIELKEGVGYLNLVSSLLHGIWTHATQRQSDGKIEDLKLVLGREHPVYSLLPENPGKIGYDNWYVRIPDLVAFLLHIRLALEANLVGTVAEGYSGTLTVSSYRNAIKLTFEQGRIADISWIHEKYVWGGNYANFPNLTFWQLVCGRRSFKELTEAFPDECCGTIKAAVLLDCLFPRFTGIVWTIM